MLLFKRGKKLRFVFSLMFCCLFVQTGWAQSSDAFNINDNNSILLSEGMDQVNITKNKNQECKENTCLVDIFLNDQHIATINYFKKFSAKIEKKDEKIYFSMYNKFDRAKKFSGFISITANLKYKDLGCALDDAYEENYLAEIPIRHLGKHLKTSMYRWISGLGCITVLSDTQISLIK